MSLLTFLPLLLFSALGDIPFFLRILPSFAFPLIFGITLFLLTFLGTEPLDRFLAGGVSVSFGDRGS